MKYNTLLALQLDNRGGSGSQNLQEVLTQGPTASIPIQISNNASTVYSTLGQATLFLRDALTNSFSASAASLTITDGVSGSWATVSPNSFSFNGVNQGLYSNVTDANIQLLNTIGNIDISGVVVSIKGVPFKQTYSGIMPIDAGATSGRISFSALSYYPSITISQKSMGSIVGLCVADITYSDFGWISTASNVGSISWIAN